jgi:hypothetical protein
VADRPSSNGPIFIVGSLGSGSTLLRLMLDSHDGIAIPQETGFLRIAMTHRWVPYWNFGGEWWKRLGLSDEDLDRTVAAHFGRIFENYAAARGKRRWGDKTPFHVWHVDLALRLFPDAVFVGIVRHPGGTAASLHDRFGYPWRRAVRHWVRSNKRLVHEAVTHPDRFTVLRYEDLVAEPELTMRSLLHWLGEPWSAAVLRHHEVQRRSGAPRVVEGHTRSDAPLDADRPARWAARLDDDARGILRRRATGLARFFGYDVDDAASREPFTGLWSGADFEGRKATHGSGVDWSLVPQPGLANELLRPPAPRRPRRPGAVPVIRVGGPSQPSVGRRIVDRLPWRVHRQVHDLRRSRDRNAR